MSESSEVQSKVLKYIFALGGYARNIIVSSRAGTNDVLACIEGRFYSIECKIGNNKPSELQLENQTEVRQAGGVAMTVYSLDDFIQQYNKVTN